MTYAEAFATWNAEIKPDVIAHYGADDYTALSESWNDYTDSLAKAGDLSDLQYHHCPAWDDDIPDDDAEYLLQAMGFTFYVSSVVERPDGLMNDSATHWKVLIKRGERLLTTYYSMGAARTEVDTTDVMGCLLSDISSIDYADNFEDWASNLGYDEDSRQAERIYNACKTLHAELSEMFSSSELSDIQDIFSGR